MKQKDFIGIIIVILIVGFYFQHSYFNEFPSFTHAWAQSDRFALALGFENNGFNFFKPETFVFNHQFPNNWNTPSSTSITAVDFPIHEYIVALFMKVFNTNSPWVFRSYIFIYSIIGMVFLYKLVRLITSQRTGALIVLLIGLTSPLFVYYQNGFLPTIPSLSNALIGLYFYFRYRKATIKRHLIIAFVFLVLAALTRTTFLIVLIGISITLFFKWIKERENFRLYLSMISSSILIILFYYSYNFYLRKEYGSIFLNQFLPIQSLDHLLEIATSIKTNWIFHYFSKIHYLIFLLIIIQFGYFIIVKKVKLSNLQLIGFKLVGWLFLGNLLFFILMGEQFKQHDYYFLDTFYLPILLLFSLFLSTISFIQKRSMLIFINGLVFLCVIPLIISAQKVQLQKRETGSWDRTFATINNFEKSEAFLNELNIPKSSKILVIDAYAPNIPFIKMNRKGFALMITSKENLNRAIHWNADYIVFQNEFFISDIYSNFPEIIHFLKVISSNGKITVCKFKKSKKSLDEFFAIKNTTPIFTSSPFQNDHNWSEKSKNSIVKLNESDEFKLTFQQKLKFLAYKSSLVKCSISLLKETDIPFELVITMDENGQNIFYRTFNLSTLIKNQNSFEMLQLYFNLPKATTNEVELKLFIWNPSKTTAQVSSFQFEVY
jgi:hypothetical protein